MHARGILDRHGARLFQDLRQADPRCSATARSACSTPPWRSTMPGATACRSSSWAAPISTPRSGRPACRPSIRRHGHQRAGARLHQVGRSAGLAAALRAVAGARLQDRDDAAARAGDARARCRAAGGDDPRSRASSYIPRYVPTSPPAGDPNAVREAARLLANAERPVIVVDRAARTAERHEAPGPARRGCCRRRSSISGGRMNFPNTHYLQPDRARPGPDRPGRRDHRPGALRLLGHRQRLRRQRRGRRPRAAREHDQARHQADQHQLRRAEHQVELPGLPALPGRRRRHGGGRRGDASGAHRGGALGAAERPQGRARQARRRHAQGLGRVPRPDPRGGGLCVGREPDQHGAARAWRSMAQIKDLDWSHGRRRRPADEQLADAAVADRQASPPHRRPGRLRRRLRRCRRRSAPRWPTARRAASRSTSRPTAT